MKILVAEDEEGIRRLCERGLRQGGYDVTLVKSGDEAVAQMDKGWDIVLTDIAMPGSVNGMELLQRIRKDSASTDVLIMTAYPELDSVVEALRQGAYDYLIKPFNLETLVHAIDKCVQKRKLSKELAMEKELRSMYEIFGSFATPEVARLALSHPQDFWKRGERKVVTVLFADVRRFTPFAERSTPEQVVAALNDIFSLMVSAVQGEGGVVNKFIGDGMMAFFGAPVLNVDHAQAAARAALNICREVDELAKRHREHKLEALRVGLGLNTGEVVAGCLGTRQRTEYSVIGHAVNVASRLEEMAKPGQILLGPETARLIRGSFKLKDCGPLTMAGVKEPLSVTELIS